MELAGPAVAAALVARGLTAVAVAAPASTAVAVAAAVVVVQATQALTVTSVATAHHPQVVAVEAPALAICRLGMVVMAEIVSWAILALTTAAAAAVAVVAVVALNTPAPLGLPA